MVKFTMMVGPSYSGKSTEAKKIAERTGAKIFSSDEIRKELYGDASVQANPQKVFNILHKRLKEHLQNGGDAIYDATNLSCKRRMAFVREIDALNLDVKKVCCVVVSTLEDIQKRMATRERKVPEEAVHRQLSQFQCPAYYEGWTKIKIIKTSLPEDCSREFMQVYRDCGDMNHDNPHHTLSVGQHMSKTMHIANQISSRMQVELPPEIIFAISAHDIGKFYTKRFENGKGEPTEVAHFIGHQGYGAYMMLIALADPDKAIRAALMVQWHMEHYLREEKSLEKIYSLLKSEGLYDYMKILEVADVQAH